MENDSQRLMDTNEIGFYCSSRMSLCFNVQILTDLITVTKKFKNSVMIIYDTQKSNYGLAPLKAYRLSEKAIATFSLNQGATIAHFVQERINQ
jgi:C-terminal region of eIF3h